MSRKKNWYDRPRRGGPSRTSLGPGPYVSIYCSGSDSNPHPKYRVCSFVPSDRPGSDDWVDSTPGYAEHDHDRYFRLVPGVTQWLVGERWLHQSERADSRDDAQFRMRWLLQCPTCGLSKPYAEPSSLAPAISALALLREDDGIVEVSLRAFIGHVRGWGDAPRG